MPGDLLTTASSIACPHGGQAILTTRNSKTSAGKMVLLVTDVHAVAGCAPSALSSLCVRIEWSAGASQATVYGTRVLVRSSVGICYNAAGSPQGVAIIVNTQLEASAR